MKLWLAFFCGLLAITGVSGESAAPANDRVYVLPIRDEIAPPLVYLVRRGVKAAMAADAKLLVIDMDTNGGRIDSTDEIIQILNQFPGTIVTYVNNKAFSAGAFISVATSRIFMAPQSVIGAAAPIMISPEGGVESMPSTVEAKMTSAVAAKVRVYAQKNGYNQQVIEAMIDKNTELKIGDEIINTKGKLLTLTNLEAEKEYGTPPKPLLSSGTFESLDAVLKHLGYGGAARVNIAPTGAEMLAFWLNAIRPILLMIGIVCIYLEMKTPGFGIPGITAIVAFALYFSGAYVAGLSGLEWLALFVLGVILVMLEIFAFPGVMAVGLAGSACMFAALVMALVDAYPGMPTIPTLPQLRMPLQQLFLGVSGAIVLAALLARFLPKTPVYAALVSTSASGARTDAQRDQVQSSRVGLVGVTLSPLRPGGKAQFGDEILDVMSQGDMIGRGEKVRIISHSGADAVVELAS